jgi:hypothetical protein
MASVSFNLVLLFSCSVNAWCCLDRPRKLLSGAQVNVGEGSEGGEGGGGPVAQLAIVEERARNVHVL